MTHQLNPYQTILSFTLEGERRETRTGPTYFKAPYSTYFHHFDLEFIEKKVVDPVKAQKYVSDFINARVQDTPDQWGIAQPTNAYGKVFFTDGWLEYCINELKKDAFTRQAAIYVPGDFKTGFLPCFTSFAFTIKHGRVSMSLFSRSVDLINGLPYDLLAFRAALYIVSDRLGMLPNFMICQMASPHIYEQDVQEARRIIALEDTNRAANRRNKNKETQ